MCRAEWSTSSTGARDPLAQVLAEHDDVDAVWYVAAPKAVGASKRRQSAT